MIQNLNCIISHYSMILLKLYIYLLFNSIHYTDKVMFLLFHLCIVFVAKTLYFYHFGPKLREFLAQIRAKNIDFIIIYVSRQ